MDMKGWSKMKRVCIGLLALLMMLALLPMSALADENPTDPVAGESIAFLEIVLSGNEYQLNQNFDQTSVSLKFWPRGSGDPEDPIMIPNTARRDSGNAAGTFTLNMSNSTKFTRTGTHTLSARYYYLDTQGRTQSIVAEKFVYVADGTMGANVLMDRPMDISKYIAGTSFDVTGTTFRSVVTATNGVTYNVSYYGAADGIRGNDGANPSWAKLYVGGTEISQGVKVTTDNGFTIDNGVGQTIAVEINRPYGGISGAKVETATGTLNTIKVYDPANEIVFTKKNGTALNPYSTSEDLDFTETGSGLSGAQTVEVVWDCESGGASLWTDGPGKMAVGIEVTDSNIASCSMSEVGSGGKTGLLTVTPKAVGETDIYIRATNGQALATVHVTVTDSTYLAYIGIPSTQSVTVGKSATLTTELVPQDATDKELEWEFCELGSATPPVANDWKPAGKGEFISVNEYGQVTAIKPTGSNDYVYVRAKAKHAAATADPSSPCRITVYAIGVESVAITDDGSFRYQGGDKYIDLYAGSSQDLRAIVQPDSATYKTVTWTVSNPSPKKGDPAGNYVSVDANGTVTAHTPIPSTATSNYATVTATAGSKTDRINVVVKASTKLTGLILNKDNLALDAGNEETLTVTLQPKNATNKKLTWTSSNPKVATVDSEGKVKAIAEGVTKITCESNDGSGKKDECQVTVSAKKVIGLYMDKSLVALVEGNSATAAASVYPSDATNKAVIWKSDNDTIATVTDKGVITGKKAGVTLVKAYPADGGDVYAACVVAVTARVYVTGITLNLPSFELLLNDTTKLKATIYPSTASQDQVTWSTSNASVCSVDKEGLLSGLKQGTAVITAKADTKATSITVTVTNQLTKRGRVVNCSRKVYVRSQPSGTSRQVGFAYKGERFDVLGTVGSWHKIQYSSSKVGYIYDNFLQVTAGTANYTSTGVVGSTGTTSTTGTTTGTTPSIPATAYTKATITNCNSWVNVRTGPGTAYEKLGTANLNTTYTYVATEGNWIKLVYGNTVAYVFADYILLS